MRSRLLLGLASIALLPALSWSADQPDPYEARVRALAHPRFVEREKAARELEAVGEPALSALRSAARSSDAELRDRAAAVAERIERAVRSKTLLAAPKLALKFDQVPLPQALTEVARKAGVRFAYEPAPGADGQRKVTLDTGEVPYWEALAAFYAAAGVIENDSPPKEPAPTDPAAARRQVFINRPRTNVEQVVRLTDGADRLPAIRDRALRVRLLPTEYAANTFDAQTGEVTFHLAVDPAPGLEMRELIGVEVRRAAADDRVALAPRYPALPARPGPGSLEQQLAIGVRQVVIVNGNMMIDDGSAMGEPHFPVTLKVGTTRPKRLAELEGVAVARVVAPPEPLVTLDDVFGKGKSQSRTAGNLNVSVLAAESGSTSTALLRVRVVSSAEAENEVLNFPIQMKGRIRPFIRINRPGSVSAGPNPDFQLAGPDGKPLKVTSARLVGSSFDGLTMTQDVELRFDKPADGLSGVNLTLSGRRPVTVEMPFVLKDVPLP